jgi:hypothetical protein
MIGVAVTAHDNLGMLAPKSHVEHPDFLDVLAGAHAPGTQDTGAHVVLDHHVTGTLVPGAERQVVVSTNRDIVLHDVALELVVRVGPPAIASGDLASSTIAAVLGGMGSIGEMLPGIALQQKVEHAAPVADGRGRFGLDHHPVSCRSGTGGKQLVLTLNRDQADPAVAHDRQLGVPAQGGDVDPDPARGLEDRGPGLEGDGCAVQGEAGHGNRW